MFRRFALPLLVLAGLSLGAWRLHAYWRAHPPAASRLVLVAAECREGSGLSPAETRVIDVLLDDALETFGDCSVIRIPTLPPTAEWGPGPEGYVIHLQPERQGPNLALHYQIGKASACRAGLPLASHRAPALPPALAYQWLREQLPSRPDSDAGRIIPTEPSHFWELVSAYAESRSSATGDSGADRLTAGAARDPRCASWHAALAFSRFTAAQNGPLPPGIPVESLDRELEEALRRAPGLPRVVSARVSFLVDRGAIHPAMTELQKARRICPRSARLLTSVEYIARYSGAFALAQAADAAAHQRTLGSRKAGLVRLSMLYAGDFEGFAQSLWPGIDSRFNGSLFFHRGHLAAVQGKTAEALAQFQAAEGSPQIAEPERRLAAAYRKALEGDRAAARAELDGLASRRIRFAMPDGEYLLRLAEGYALTGDEASALEWAGRAFQHGFGCTRWFEHSPLLEPIRKGPRWNSLHQHLLERQALLERHLRPEAWGL